MLFITFNYKLLCLTTLNGRNLKSNSILKYSSLLIYYYFDVTDQSQVMNLTNYSSLPGLKATIIVLLTWFQPVEWRVDKKAEIEAS